MVASFSTMNMTPLSTRLTLYAERKAVSLAALGDDVVVVVVVVVVVDDDGNGDDDDDDDDQK